MLGGRSQRGKNQDKSNSIINKIQYFENLKIRIEKNGEFLCSLILKMEKTPQHSRPTVPYFFKKGKNATETQKKVCALYGEGEVTD